MVGHKHRLYFDKYAKISAVIVAVSVGFVYHFYDQRLVTPRMVGFFVERLQILMVSEIFSSSAPSIILPIAVGNVTVANGNV